MTNTNTDVYGFSADRPIESASEDLLGRADFAQNLGEAIYNWKGKDSLVVALYGEWGSGKSSIKNMALSHLKQKESHKPTIIEFSPWEWAAQEKITKAFFDEISKAICREDDSTNNEKLAAIFKKYGTYLSLGEAVLSSTSSSIPTLLPILAGIGALSSLFDSTIITTTIMATLAIYISVMKWGAEKLKVLSEHFDTRSKDSQKSLHEIREELTALLSDRDSSILIVMDDLDRLTSSELRMIFQLVKVNTVFPNVTFLLLFQKNIVEKKLTDSTQSGKEYLEKIIQVPFNIPQVESSKMYNVLFEKLDSILELDESFKTQFDQKRWSSVFENGMKYYFTNLRNIYRYVSTLSFHFSILKGRKVFEANPVDLIGIECIRVFEPDTYHEIHKNKDFFSKNNLAVLSIDDQNNDEKTLESIIKTAHKGNRLYIKNILIELFPNLNLSIRNRPSTQASQEEWFLESRICHHKNFDQYFQLSREANKISKSYLIEFIEKTNNTSILKTEINLLNKRGDLLEFFTQFNSYKDKIPLENTEPFLNALLDAGDFVDNTPSGFFNASNPQENCYKLSVWLLQRIKEKTSRASLLSNHLKKLKGLYIIIRILQSDEKNRLDRKETLLADEEFLTLKNALAIKIQKRAKYNQNKIIKHRDFLLIINTWKEWGDDLAVREWVKEYTSNTHSLILFLSKMIQRVHRRGGDNNSPGNNRIIKISRLENFLDISRVESLINSADTSQLSADESAIIKLFNQALEERRNGKEDAFS